MDETHLEALRRNWINLIENLIPNEVLDHMLEKNVLTHDMYEEIRAKPTRKDQITEFLFVLQRRGPEAFAKFISALEATHQDFIAQQLTACVNDIINNQNNVQPMQE